MQKENAYIRWFEDLSSKDVPLVGGKNASLGEMIRMIGEMTSILKEEGILVPDGFATAAKTYWKFLEANDLKGRIQSYLEEMKNGKRSLEKTGKSIRDLFLKGDFTEEIAEAIRDAYHELCGRYDTDEVDVAVRSSATAKISLKRVLPASRRPS